MQKPSFNEGATAWVSTTVSRNKALRCRPSTVEDQHQVPVIDFAKGDEQCADLIWKACQEIGFFKIKNHNIPESDIEDMFQLNRQFMQFDQDEKEAFPFQRDELRGYSYKKQVQVSTGTPDQKEDLLIPCRTGAMDGRWPNLPRFEERTRSFTMKCHALSLRVMGLLEKRLGMVPGYLARIHPIWTPSATNTLRLLHYPPVNDPAAYADNLWRSGAHTDFGSLTLLFQRQGEAGLECAANPLSRHDDGGAIRYTRVDPEPGTITCNIGDMMMKLSDEKLLSNLHRVRLPSPDAACFSRFSMAFFLQPEKNALVESKKYGAHRTEDLIRAHIHARYEAERPDGKM
jgi:isopenicillin N synthase-like dioxygenase